MKTICLTEGQYGLILQAKKLLLEKGLKKLQLQSKELAELGIKPPKNTFGSVAAIGAGMIILKLMEE